MSRIWPLVGGIHPEEHKLRSLQQPIAKAEIADRLVLPVEGQFGAVPEPVVAVGESVLKGQLIAKPQSNFGAFIHAPTSGVITDIGLYPLPHASGMSGRCIVLTPDGEDQWIEHKGDDDFGQLTSEQLIEKIKHAGITGLGGAGFPSHIKLAANAIDTLIINAAECEPYITADDALMQHRAAEIITGIKILQHILNKPNRTLIGIEDNKPEAIAQLKKALSDTPENSIELVIIPTKYPSGGEKQLIQILTGKEVPSGGLPAQLGIICQNIGTAYAVKRAIVDGEPLISRITTITGDGCDINRNVEVLLGTPIQALLQQHQYKPNSSKKVIMGGPMMGFTLQDLSAPVVKTTNCILALGKEEGLTEQPEQACIRCGICAEACPASLLPQQLLWYAKAEQHDRLLAHDLMDCIECGACEYVCPSSIPLVQYYRSAKSDIRTAQQEKAKAAISRERFEYRKLRLEQQAAEKEAKRAERRKAAEAAQAKVSSANGDKPQSSADDLIKAAMARVAQKKADPAAEVAKLERHLESATNRLTFAQQQLADADTSDAATIEKLTAQRDAAQLKHQQMQEKLEKAKQSLATNNLNSSPEQPDVIAKITATPVEKLRASVASLQQRITTTEQKIADSDDDGIKQALLAGLTKLQGKLATTQAELAEAEQQPQQTGAPNNTEQTLDAASAAIARAKANAEARENMSAAEKQRADIDSLKQRLKKAEQKAAQAEADNSEHLSAFQSAVEKLREKLATLEQHATEDDK